MKRAALALLVISAIAAGLAGGLYYAWVLDPVEYSSTAPYSLYAEDKLVYLALIGDLYAHDEDLMQAKAQLAELGVEADGPVLAELVEQYLDSGGQPEEVRNLARLAEDLGASGGVLLVFGPEPTPSAAPTPSDIAQPGTTPTPTPPATPAPSFRLMEQTALCAEPDQPGRIIVSVQDAQGNELAAVQVVASWSTGQDRFFTGLRPELGAGYTDFEMSPHVEYEVTLADFRGDVAQGLTSDLSPGVCPTDTIALNWNLVFEQEE